MPSDDYSIVGGGGANGDAIYTVMALLSSIFLAIAFFLVQWELYDFYRVIVFWFRGA